MLQQYNRILVAIDGSKEAELAFKKGVQVAVRNNSSLILAHIIDTRAFQSISTFDGSMAEKANEQATTTLEEYVRYAKNHRVTDISYSIEYGSPKVLIAKQIPEDKEIDLILLGATGLNAVERIFIGSVSEYVIRHAACDVLIVRTDLDNVAKS
ncbi:Nucleotide-binding universal stress protein, UspA family [Carnobacterium iners]|uniref:Universal stress protein n=1 Tax=Carnobacterium iners TaxID=1073423 RepID=A0A1X7NP66_9LACT|nr:universal stress protein [Carnobacterium iners]SEK32401.1 Nucleotide-binding universal stress protein, UspA family [Carnobacterium iners]SMH39045.1 Nucleotide-binding universal stress protein, UspA family [Carnobacterium iners]